MLCCVSKRSASGADPEPPRVPSRLSTTAPQEVILKFETNLQREEDVPPILLPCAICARTFKPQTLEKHIRICEQTTVKKRKPFDSAKQRIQGTELAEFLPKNARRRVLQEERPGKSKSSWKQTHDEFVRAIRAARGEIDETSPPMRYAAAVVPAAAPTRANEKGMCPTCNRQFGIKAYDRHVAWCKERANRLPVSPATNIAKERLEARIKYRAPALKNRRPTNREKYSPGSAINLTVASKASPPSVTAKAKESASVPICNKGNDSPVKPKLAAGRRPGQNREPPIPPGPIRSRLVDRTNRPGADCESGPATSRSLQPTSRRRSHLPVPPTKSTKVKNTSPPPHPKCSRKPEIRPNVASRTDQSPRFKNHDQTAKAKPNLVSARSNNNPKLNDVAVNEEIIGMTVQPCNIYQDHNMVTWRQISEEKIQAAELMKSQSTEFTNDPVNERASDTAIMDEEKNILSLGIGYNRQMRLASPGRGKIVSESKLSVETEKPAWTENIQKLDKTYLITESGDTEIDLPEIVAPRRWKPVKNSPRVEFCLKEVKSLSMLESASKQYDYRNLDSPTNFNVNVNFTSTPMQIKDDTLEEENDIVPDYDNSVEPTGWSGGLKMPETLDLDLGLLEPYEEESVILTSPRIQSPTKAGLIKTRSSPAGKKKKKPVIKRTPRLKPVCNNDPIIEEPLNFRNHEYDYETPRSSRIISKKLDYVAEILSPKQRVTKKSTSACKRKSKTSDKSINRCNQENTLHPQVTPRSPEKNHNEAKSSAYPFISRPTVPRSSLGDPFDTKGKFVATPVVCNSPTPTQQLLENDEAIKNISPDMNRLEINVDCPLASSAKSRSRERVPKSDGTRKQLRNKNFSKNENCAFEPLEVSVRGPCAIKNDDIRVEADDRCNVNRKSTPESLSEKEYPQADPEPESDSVKLDGCIRRRCGTYVIEKHSCVSTKHHVSDESPEDKPVQKRRRTENMEDPGCTIDYDERNDSLNSSAVSKTLLEKTKEDDVTINDEMRQIFDKYINSNFDYDSDNTVVDVNTRDKAEPVVLGDTVRTGEPSSLFNDAVKARSDPHIASSVRSTKSGISESNRTDRTEMHKRMRENMNILKGSTDTLISSADAAPLSGKSPLFVGPYDREICTIQTITCAISTPVQFLPRINQELMPESARPNSEKRLKTPQPTYWERAARAAQNKLITLDPPKDEFKLVKRNPRIHVLPPMIPSEIPPEKQRGVNQDYDPFLAAERQMNELFSDTSDQSIADSPAATRASSSTREQNQFPLSHSSAFVKYPSSPSVNKRTSVIAPPSEFDDFISDFSSDSTETNSASQDIFINNLTAQTRESEPRQEKQSRDNVRRVVIDKSKPASANDVNPNSNRGKSFISSAEKTRKILEKVSPKIVRPTVNRSHSVRAASAPKAPERKNSVNSMKKANSQIRNYSNMSNNNYVGISGSNMSLSSVLSSEVDIQRSNSLFDDLLSSFEDDGTSFPSLKSFLKSNSMSSPIQGSRNRDGQVSDEDLSSPDSYKRQDHSKLSADSAYSSLNRKCYNHGRSTNDVASRHDEDAPRRRDTESVPIKGKLTRFCHECGSRFPETAKFCCECGVKRLAL